MDVLFKPKGIRQKKRQKKQLWLFRVSQKAPVERKSFVKYARRMQRYAKRGQLRNGIFYCKAGKEITQARLDHYEALCHFMVRKFMPALALWEASMAYDDLINQCKIEIFLMLLNGFNPKKVMGSKVRTQKEADEEMQKLEQSTAFGRLKSYLRRQLWKFHPEQFGGVSWSFDQIVFRDRSRGKKTWMKGEEGQESQEFQFGLYEEKKDPLVEIDFLLEQKDRLIEILKQGGAEAAKEAFLGLDPECRDRIGDLLFEQRRSKWNELANFVEDEQCSLE